MPYGMKRRQNNSFNQPSQASIIGGSECALSNEEEDGMRSLFVLILLVLAANWRARPKPVVHDDDDEDWEHA